MNVQRYRIGKTSISVTSPNDTIQRIEKALENKMNTYICVSNPRTVVHANKHTDYLEVMHNSYMNLPDAEPIIWAARLWGLKNVKRTMGPYLFKDMLSKPSSGINHYLLGDTNETLDKLKNLFLTKYNSRIVGVHSPPFCSLDQYDYKHIANLINNSGANIVWLSLRSPKQDFFAVNLLPYLNNKICIGVGAAFRFNLGEYKMAPTIIKKLGLMGLFWGKKSQKFFPFLFGYFKDNVPYIFLLLKIIIKRISGKKYYE